MRKTNPGLFGALAIFCGLFLTATASPAALLYDQTSNAVENSNLTSQNFEEGQSVFDTELADDFTVPEGETWNVSRIVVYGTRSNGNTEFPVPSATVVFYGDNEGLPGTEFGRVENVVPAVPSNLTDLDLVFPGAVALPAGTYWVSVVVNLDFALGGQWFWDLRSPADGNPGVWRNPGGGFGTSCSGFNYFSVCGAGLSGGDALFQLHGEPGGGNAAEACPEAPAMSCTEHRGPANFSLGGGKTNIMNAKFTKAVVDAESLGDPTQPDGTDYHVCLYADGSLAGEWSASAGDPGFKRAKDGSISYNSHRNPDRLTMLKAVPGDGKGSLSVQAKSVPTLPLAVESEVIVQFVNSNACWSQTFNARQVTRDTAMQFRANFNPPEKERKR
jgi:hypothetical protein